MDHLYDMKINARTWLLICCAAVPWTAQAQPSNLNDNGVPLHSSLVIKATPSSLLDRFCAMIPVGAEYNYKKRLGIGVNWAIPVIRTKHIRNTNIVEQFNRNVKADVYLRCYFSPAKRNQFFIGVEWFYKEQFYHINAVSYEDDSYMAASDNADIRKFVTGFGFYLGERFNLKKNWGIDLYAGMGTKTVINHVYADNKKIIGGHNEAMFPDEDSYNGTRSPLYFPFGLSLNYRF